MAGASAGALARLGFGVSLRLHAEFVEDTEKQNGSGDDPASRDPRYSTCLGTR